MGIHERPPYEPDKHGLGTHVDVRAATTDDIEAIARIDEARGKGSVETLVPASWHRSRPSPAGRSVGTTSLRR